MKRNLLIASLIFAMFVSFPIDCYSQSKKETLREILEKFCREEYSKCFSGRTYNKNTLTVEDYNVTEDGTIKVTGLHTYEGMFGKEYSSMLYKAEITINLKKPNLVKIEFHKRSKADILNKEDYWEVCTKTIDMAD